MIDEGTPFEQKIPINNLRKGRKITPDSARFYNGHMKPSTNRMLFPRASSLESDEKGTTSLIFPPQQSKDKDKGSASKNSCSLQPRKPSPEEQGGSTRFGQDSTPMLQEYKGSSSGMFALPRDQFCTPVSGMERYTEDSSSIPTAISTSQIDWDKFRPYRMAIVNRITEDSGTTTEDVRVALNRIHDILSGADDVGSRTIVTVALDLMVSGDSRWTDEFKINFNIDKMLKMIRLSKR